MQLLYWVEQYYSEGKWQTYTNVLPSQYALTGIAWQQFWVGQSMVLQPRTQNSLSGNWTKLTLDHLTILDMSHALRNWPKQ